MTIAERIERDYIDTYKAKDQQRLDTLRLLKTAVKNRQVALRRSLEPLDDATMLDIIDQQAKQRQDSIEQFTAAGRPDLAAKEAAELAILKGYLPEPLSPEALDQAVSAAIEITGARDMKGMGAVMQAVMNAHKGQVDGKQLSALVRARLTS
ncbi:MAG: GatB/YqeY domain-containing protein [Deltaproteobacteria bacterium]|jgi:uncharacterized protein YqeY|nr:GatB/YqeY domain-containing protein [Deltaproteobacteria bacterium]